MAIPSGDIEQPAEHANAKHAMEDALAAQGRGTIGEAHVA